MWFGVVFSWHVVDNICFCYCIEFLVISHEVTYTFAEAADLDVVIPQEGVTRLFSHYHDCLWIHFG